MGFLTTVLFKREFNKHAFLIGVLAMLCTAETPVKEPRPEYLNETKNRREVARIDEGVRLFPYEWLLVLMSEAGFRRYGFLMDHDDPGEDPKHPLPIGFTVYTPHGPEEEEFGCKRSGDQKVRLRQVGLNCMGCHTSELQYTNPRTGHRHILRVHGGPSMQDNLGFMKTLTYEVLPKVLETDETVRAFAKNLQDRKQDHRDLSKEEIKECIRDFIADRRKRSFNSRYKNYQDVYPIEWGFGRFDAFGRGGNTLFKKLDDDNIEPANAPVSIPAVWNTVLHYDRFQWNGAIRDYKARYIAQALGMDAFINLGGNPNEKFTGFDSDALEKIANWYDQIAPPAWRSDIFDERVPDGATPLMKEGKRLYKKLCAGCHVPKVKGKLYELNVIKLKDIGTDPTAAENFARRKVKTTNLQPEPGLGKIVTAAVAVQHLTSKILKKRNDENRLIPELAYVARPHAGVWATPPFLHNGSIPNIYLLLSPQEERDAQARTFCLGDLEFDPKHIGFVLKGPPCRKTEFLFDTTLSGNRNTGHEFRSDDRHGRKFEPEKECTSLAKHSRDGILGCELNPSDRQAVVEYLKSCDFVLPWDDNPEVIKPCPYPPPNPAAYR